MTRLSSFKRQAHDHFEPQDDSDPTAQRRLRGQLEQIDYTAFASNREVIGAVLGQADAAKFQRLAVAADRARPLVDELDVVTAGKGVGGDLGHGRRRQVVQRDLLRQLGGEDVGLGLIQHLIDQAGHGLDVLAQAGLARTVG